MIDLVQLSIAEQAFAVLVVLGASIVRGYSGFGFSAVLVAGLSFVIEPIEAVPLAVGLGALASIVQGSSVWADIHWRRFWVLLAAAVVGNPIGVLVLTSVDADPLRAVTFVTLAVLTIALLFGQRFHVSPSIPVFFGVGVLAGIVNGATAMSGLVLVLAMTLLRVAPAEMRGTLVAYFFASNLVVLGLLARADELDSTYSWRVVCAVPLMIVGVALGTRAFRDSTVESFRRATLLLLLAISAIGILRLLVG